MVTNPDPKPGRWILPLVVLGMVAFTYFFVRELPTGVDDPVIPATTLPSDTTLPEGPDPEDPTAATAPPGVADPAAQAYLEGVDGVYASLLELQVEMAAINSGFDADPREVEYADAVARLRTLGDDAEDLLDAIDALTPPEALTADHDAIRTAVATAAGAADDALAGLQSTDDGTQRRNAIAAFDQAVADLENAVASARASAGGIQPATPDPGEDPDDSEDEEGDDGDG
jgi:hypothetical protein